MKMTEKEYEDLMLRRGLVPVGHRGVVAERKPPSHTAVLPLPPSLNHAYITAKGGKRIMTKECRDYKEAAGWQLAQAFKGGPHEKLALLRYRFYFPDNRARDIDNYGKVLRDVLKGALVKDDCWQCVAVEVFGPHAIDKDNPRVEIEWEL